MLHLGRVFGHTVTMGRGGVRLTPGAGELRAYLDQGLTQQQIADAWEKKTGQKVGRSAIGMAIGRAGLESPNPKPRYDDLLPWTVKSEHSMHYEAQLLRMEARRRRGKDLSEKNLRILTKWRKELQDANAVVTYDPATPDGFYWTPRLPTDEDIIRRPE